MVLENNNEDQSDLSGFKYAWYKENHYTINTKSYLTLGRGKANETEIEEDWTIIPGEYRHITVKSSAQKFVKSDGQMKTFYEILEQINKAIDVLEIFLASDKSIQKIENTEEILAKWNQIKRELHFYELVRESYDQFISTYDRELNEIDNNIKHNLLYQIMFYPLPIFNEEDITPGIPDRPLMSILFPGKAIAYSSQYNILKEPEGYKVLLKGTHQNSTEDLEKIYESSYKRTLKIPMDYNMQLEGEYIYNGDSVLSEVLFHIKEQLNTEMFYVCRYHIKLNKP